MFWDILFWSACVGLVLFYVIFSLVFYFISFESYEDEDEDKEEELLLAQSYIGYIWAGMKINYREKEIIVFVVTAILIPGAFCIHALISAFEFSESSEAV